MYNWYDYYKEECATKRFVQDQDYEIYRRSYCVWLRYYGSVSTKKGDKTADVFYGEHSGGTNAGELLYFAVMNGRYACSPDIAKALQKLWSGKTNVLHGIYRRNGKEIVRA